jgi:hypothetical protein
MSKNKWTIIPFIVIAFLIACALYYFVSLKPTAHVEPLRAIPLNSALIIKVNNFKALVEKTSTNNDLWNALKTIPGFKLMDKQLHFIDSLVRFVPQAEEIIKYPPFFISAHITGKEKISLIHIFQLSPHFNDNKIHDLISDLVINVGTISKRKYEGATIYEVSLLSETSVKNFSYAITHNILLISFSTILLEDAIRQIASNEPVTSLKGFNEIYATSGKNVDANIYINFQHFSIGLSTFVIPDYKAEVRAYKSFANWSAMDVNLMSDMILMNGFVNLRDSVSSVASLFVNQMPQRITADKILPGSVASFLTISLSDAGQYFTDFKTFLRDRGILTSYNNTLRSLTNTYDTDFLQDFTDIMDNEMTLAFDAGKQPDSASLVYFLVRIKSGKQAEEKLDAIIRKIALLESKPVSSYSFNYRIDNELAFNIHYIPIRKLTGKIFGNFFSVLDEHYYVIIDNYLVFSSSVEALKSLIYNQVLDKTIQNDKTYKEFKNSLSPRSNLYFYCNLSKGYRVYSQYLVNTINQSWEKYNPVFHKVQIMGLQLFSNNNMLYNNFLLKYLSDYYSETETVWESRLDTLADFKPVFVINHQTKQNEVFVQDLNNNIYLINQVGRILWKIQLSEPINSEVFQVDYFRNGKLQLLFSTRNNLYVIDRKGNFVEKYPIKLRSPATSGVSVFDYDNNRDYRLFIPCEDRKVYAYNKEGNLVSGWIFDKSESEVTQPINHFRIVNKDFLVFGDRFRTYILDRRGNTRISVDTFFQRSSRNNYFLDIPLDGSGPRFVTTDTTGKVYFIYLDGTVKTLELSKFTDKHYFEYKDLNGDGKPELIYLENNQLTVYNNKKSKLFTYKFKDSVFSCPMYYQFSATDRKLGIVCRNENLIYLINNNGKLYSDFPLQGNTPFSIGNFGDTLSRFNLVVGSKDNFLYNYRVR